MAETYRLRKLSGYQHAAKGSLSFYDRNILFYLSGQMGVLHNLKNNSQKFVSLREDNKITALYLDPNYFLVIGSRGKKPTVAVINLITEEKRVLPKPKGIRCQEYTWVSFSGQNERVAAQASGPGWELAVWNWTKKEVETVFRPFRLEPKSLVYKFEFHPGDFQEIAVVGRNFLRFYHHKEGMKIQETVEHEQERSHQRFHSVTWNKTSGEVAIGTSKGTVLIFQNTQLVRIVHVSEQISEEMSSVSEDKNITCTSFTSSGGLICSYGSSKVLILKEELVISRTLYIKESSKESRICQLAVDLQEDRIAAATKDGRIHAYSLKKGDGNNFEVIQDYHHTQEVAYCNTISNLYLQATSSSDSFILRNFATGEVLLRSKMDSGVRNVCIHPLGISVLIGFEKFVKFFNILYDTLQEVHTFSDMENSQDNFLEEISGHYWGNQSSKKVSFAPSGHLMAISGNKCIHIIYTIGFRNLTKLKGHKQDVEILLWRNDNRLLSSDRGGTLYEWNIPRQKSSWNLSLENVCLSSLALPSGQFLKNLTYVAGSDGVIRLVENGLVIGRTKPLQTKVTAMTATLETLVAGTEDGTVLGFPTSLGAVQFQTRAHASAIINLTCFHDESSIIAVDKDGIISTWSNGSKKEDESKCGPEEVLVLIDEQDACLKRLSELEAHLNILNKKAEESLLLKTEKYEAQVSEEIEKCKHVQDLLKNTLNELYEELETLKANKEEENVSKRFEILHERNANEEDFLEKLWNEEDVLKEATQNRSRQEEARERMLQKKTEEKQCELDEFKKRYKRYEDRVRELEENINKELIAQREIDVAKYALHKDSEEVKETEANNQDSEADQDQGENERRDLEIKEAKAELQSEKERCRNLKEEFREKENKFEKHKETIQRIKQKINQVQSDIERIETVVSVKNALCKELEDEINELTIQGDQRLRDDENLLQNKKDELAQVQEELQKCKDAYNTIHMRKKTKKREEAVLGDRLKSTENSVTENNRKLLASELLLEKYHSEFVSATENCPTKASLRWALLKLYEKRGTEKSEKDDESVAAGDTDPYLRFCKQRDHYENMINVVTRTTAKIQNAFKKNYSRLTKENSDWTAFAESLRADIRQKQSRIKALEDAVGMKSTNFSVNPTEARRRLNVVAETFRQLESAEDEALNKRVSLVEEQEKEIQRLHGILTVEEKSKIIRKMR